MKEQSIIRLLFYCCLFLISTLSLLTQETEKQILDKYGFYIHRIIHQNITASLFIEFYKNTQSDEFHRVENMFNHPEFSILDTGCHYRFSFFIDTTIYFPSSTKILVGYKFYFSINFYHNFVQMKDTAVVIYEEPFFYNERIKEKQLYETGLMAIDTISYNSSLFICGTYLSDRFETEYFNRDSSKKGFDNYIKIKFYNYKPKIESINYKELTCTFFSELTNKSYKCKIEKTRFIDLIEQYIFDPKLQYKYKYEMIITSSEEIQDNDNKKPYRYQGRGSRK